VTRLARFLALQERLQTWEHYSDDVLVQLAEDFNDRSSFKWPGFAEGYVQGRVWIEVHFRIALGVETQEYVGIAIREGLDLTVIDLAAVESADNEAILPARLVYDDERAMLVFVPQFVEKPQFVPFPKSVVWLNTLDEFKSLQRDVCEVTAPDSSVPTRAIERIPVTGLVDADWERSRSVIWYGCAPRASIACFRVLR